jgi:hypothetical protein
MVYFIDVQGGPSGLFSYWHVNNSEVHRGPYLPLHVFVIGGKIANHMGIYRVIVDVLWSLGSTKCP